MDIAYVSFSNHVCPIFTIYTVSTAELRRYVSMCASESGCMYTCVYGGDIIYLSYHIYIYIQFEKND